MKVENGGKEAGSTKCYLRIDAAPLIFCIYIHRDVSKNFIIRTASKAARLYLHFSASSPSVLCAVGRSYCNKTANSYQSIIVFEDSTYFQVTDVSYQESMGSSPF